MSYFEGEKMRPAWRFYSLHDDHRERLEFIDRYPKGWSHMSRDYPSKEAALAAESLGEDKPCRVCGGLVLIQFMNASRLIERNLCFSCNHWQEVVDEMGSHPHRYVIKGRLYTAKPNAKGGGFGGSHFIVRPFGKDAFDCWDVWHGGEVPPQFRHLLPDTAEFLNARGFVKIEDTYFMDKDSDAYHPTTTPTADGGARG